jgi:hypothetical protein
VGSGRGGDADRKKGAPRRAPEGVGYGGVSPKEDMVKIV